VTFTAIFPSSTAREAMSTSPGPGGCSAVGGGADPGLDIHCIVDNYAAQAPRRSRRG
jgi:hypothetical protein